jgi:hypothetical protein
LASPVIGNGVQLFKEIAPNVTRVWALFRPSSPICGTYFRSAETAAQALGIAMTAAENPQPFDRLIEIARSDFATDEVLDDMQAIEADAD